MHGSGTRKTDISLSGSYRSLNTSNTPASSLSLSHLYHSTNPSTTSTLHQCLWRQAWPRGLITTLKDRSTYSSTVFPNGSMLADWDLIKAIHDIYVHKLQLQNHCCYEWVRGHQDRLSLTAALTPPARFNIRADSLQMHTASMWTHRIVHESSHCSNRQNAIYFYRATQ